MRRYRMGSGISIDALATTGHPLEESTRILSLDRDRITLQLSSFSVRHQKRLPVRE